MSQLFMKLLLLVVSALPIVLLSACGTMMPQSPKTPLASQTSPTVQEAAAAREASEMEGRIVKVTPQKGPHPLIICIRPCPEFDVVIGYEVTRKRPNGELVTVFEKVAPTLPTLPLSSADGY